MKEIESRRSARKQTAQLKEEETERERDAPFFSHEIYFCLRVTLWYQRQRQKNLSVEKLSNKKNKIMITNDMGRFSREDIERMVNEAERYHTEDEKQRKRVAAKTTSSHIALK